MSITRRKVYFYGAKAIGDGEPPWDTGAVLTGLRALPFPSYMADGDDQVFVVLEPEDQRSRFVRLRIIRSRRAALPSKEHDGMIEDLGLLMEEGLAEISHVVLELETNRLAFEYNHHGPRPRLLERYLMDQLRWHFALETFIDSDVMAALERAERVTRLDVTTKMSQSTLRDLANADSTWGALERVSQSFGRPRRISIEMAPEPGDRDFGRRAKRFIKTVFQRDAQGEVTRLNAHVTGPDYEGTYPLEFLVKSIWSEVDIPSAGDRLRTLDSAAAFREIEAAFRTQSGRLRDVAHVDREHD